MPALPRPHTQTLYLRLERLRPNSQPSTLSLGEQEGGCPASPRGGSGVQVSQNMPRRVLPHLRFCVQLRVWISAQLLEIPKTRGKWCHLQERKDFRFPAHSSPKHPCLRHTPWVGGAGRKTSMNISFHLSSFHIN